MVEETRSAYMVHRIEFTDGGERTVRVPDTAEAVSWGVKVKVGNQSTTLYPWHMIVSVATTWKYRTTDEETHNGSTDPS